jgi:hypothetical protein
MGFNLNIRLSSLFCFLLASMVALHAQEFPFDSFTNLRSRFPADTNVWTKDQYTDYNRQIALSLVDVVWKFRQLNKTKPGIVSILSPPRDPPTWDRNSNSVNYPVSFARDMSQLGFMLGRDIYIGSWRRLHEDKPITQHPFFDGHLVKAIDSSINSVSPIFEANASLITCTNTERGCVASQGLGALAIQLFLVAHECGHYVLGHQGARDLEQELAADRYAWDTLRAVAKSLHGDDEKSNQYYDLLLGAAAEAPLWYQRQSKAWFDVIGAPSGKEEDEIMSERIDQIEKLADDLDGDHMVSEFMPSRFTGWTVHPTSVSFERIPQLLVIAGVSVKPEELSGKKFRLPSEGTDWIATDAQGVACQSSFDNEQVAVKYTPWTQADLNTIGALAKAKKWCDVIAATADAQLQPRSPSVAPYLNRALYYCGAGDFIDPATAENPQDRTAAERYQRISVGVRSWGLP